MWVLSCRCLSCLSSSKGTCFCSCSWLLELPLPFLLVILKGDLLLQLLLAFVVAVAFLACHPRRGPASAVAVAFLPTTQKISIHQTIVISTEAAHGTIVSSTPEKPALSKAERATFRLCRCCCSLFPVPYFSGRADAPECSPRWPEVTVPYIDRPSANAPADRLQRCHSEPSRAYEPARIVLE